MINAIPLVRDYKANVPLHMLENKYKIPIHEIIKILYGFTVEKGLTCIR